MGVLHHAENGLIHRKMVVDWPLVIPTKAKPFSRPDQTTRPGKRDNWSSQSFAQLPLGLVVFMLQHVSLFVFFSLCAYEQELAHTLYETERCLASSFCFLELDKKLTVASV